MSWKKLTPAAKKKITADWQAAFPGFGIYEPMHLLRRTGPLLSGIYLEKYDGGSYRPIFHVHNLSRSSPNVTLSCYRNIPYEYVQVDWHESKFPKMVKGLSERIFLPLSGPITLAEVVKGFHSYLKEPLSPCESYVYQNLALICGWCGNSDQVATVLREAEDVMRRWPETVLKQIGGLEQWLSTTRASAANQEALRATVVEQISVHGVENIPATELR